MGGFAGDLRLAARMLVRSPGVSGIAVAALGLGVGVTATMFSIVYGALMRGLPFEDGDRIMALVRTNPSREIRRAPASVHDYLDWRSQQSSFSGMGAYYEGTVNVRWADEPERFDGAFVTAGLFPTLGVAPVLGRGFAEGEDAPGAPMRVLLSHRIWLDRFAGDPSVLGRVVKVNGEAGEVVGVMPEGFSFPESQAIWVPLRLDPLVLPRGEGTQVSVVGKLGPGVSPEQASAELEAIARRLAAAHPDTNHGWGAEVIPFTDLAIGEETAGLLYSMLAVVSLVLLIACANVANLLLARAAARTREVGIRTAMGAGRWRVVSQMVAEALALALAGGVLGAAMASLGIGWFNRAIEGTNPPFFLVFKLDAPILLFILAVSVTSAVVAGGIPALKASATDVSGILKDGSRGSSGLRIGRLTRVLVVGEIAMSMGLLVAAGLMTKSITTLRDVEMGFDAGSVYTARLGLFESEFPDTVSRRAFFRDLRGRLDAAPGVGRAALATVLPGLGHPGGPFAVEGAVYADERAYPEARFGLVDPGYFQALGSSVVVGRDFEEGDDADGEPVVLVNASFAARHFPDGSPLGRRIRQGGPESAEPWRTVVGVVPDAWVQGLGNDRDPPDGFYVPLQQADARFVSIVARGPADPMSLAGPVRDAVASVHPDTPLYFVRTLQGRIDDDNWAFTVFGTLFMVFGGVALFLAAVGLYGVMAFSVSRRTPEVGVRMAMGAEAGQVLRLILRQGMAQVLLGLALGLGMALLVSFALRNMLFQVSPNDPVVFTTVAGVLLLTGLAASAVPARRATRVDPLTALRGD